MGDWHCAAGFEEVWCGDNTDHKLNYGCIWPIKLKKAILSSYIQKDGFF
jgi:hypothetical protein